VSKENELNPLLYALFKAVKEFRVGLKEYEQKKPELGKGEVLDSFKQLVSEIASNYDLSSIDELLPAKYRPLYRVIKREKFDQVVDLASGVIKEYAKDERGEYKSLEETLLKVVFKKILAG
jgi:retron-type reverse transcriptase